MYFQECLLGIALTRLYSTGPHYSKDVNGKPIKFETHFELKGNVLSQIGSNTVLTMFFYMFGGTDKVYFCNFNSVRKVLPLIPMQNMSVWNFSEAKLGRGYSL